MLFWQVGARWRNRAPTSRFPLPTCTGHSEGGGHRNPDVQSCPDRSPDCGLCWQHNPVPARHSVLLCTVRHQKLSDIKNGYKVFFYIGMKTTIMRFPSDQNGTFGTFLLAHRGALSSGDVGLHPLPGRRRARGLQREEATQLRGASTIWVPDSNTGTMFRILQQRWRVSRRL